MAQKWADTQRVERFGPQTDRFRSPRPEEQNTVSIIQNLLDKFINPEAAAHIIATIYEPRLLKGEKISVWPFTLLSRAIIYPETTAENHQHIAEMLVCLSKLPDVIVDGRPLKENGRTYWRDIPEFGIWFAECALSKCCSANPRFICLLIRAYKPHRCTSHRRHRSRQLPSELARTSTAIQIRQWFCCALS